MFQKFTNGYEGMCMSGKKFLKKWQVRDKILDTRTKNKGPVMSRGWSYVMPMTSHVMWHHRCDRGGGVGYGKFKLDNLWQITHKLLSKYFIHISYLFLMKYNPQKC